MPVGRQPIFVRVDRNSVHRELVSRTEDTDSNFLRICVSYRSRWCPSGRTPRFATRIFVNGPLWPAAFLRIVWMECTGVPGALGVTANIGASLGGCSVLLAIAVEDGGGTGARNYGSSSGCKSDNGRQSIGLVFDFI